MSTSEFLELPPGVDTNAPEAGLFTAYMSWPARKVLTVRIVGSDRMTGKVLIESIKTGQREWISRLGLQDR